MILIKRSVSIVSYNNRKNIKLITMSISDIKKEMLILEGAIVDLFLISVLFILSQPAKAQNDREVSELNLIAERYLPFEGMRGISS